MEKLRNNFIKFDQAESKKDSPEVKKLEEKQETERLARELTGAQYLNIVRMKYTPISYEY